MLIRQLIWKRETNRLGSNVYRLEAQRLSPKFVDSAGTCLAIGEDNDGIATVLSTTSVDLLRIDAAADAWKDSHHFRLEETRSSVLRTLELVESTPDDDLLLFLCPHYHTDGCRRSEFFRLKVSGGDPQRIMGHFGWAGEKNMAGRASIDALSFPIWKLHPGDSLEYIDNEIRETVNNRLSWDGKKLTISYPKRGRPERY